MKTTEMTQEIDHDIVAIWLRRDPIRWGAGLLAGFAAAVIALMVAMVLSKMGGRELLFPIKVCALPFLGSQATEFTAPISTLIVGMIAMLGFGGFWGAVFAHFTGTNRVPALLGVGLVWGLFTWVFWFSLFLFSFKAYYWAQVSPAMTFPVAVTYGLSLATVSIFDRALRGSRA